MACAERHRNVARDHRKVKQLFDEFDARVGQRRGIRDFLFGAAEEQIDQKESIDGAREEHHVVRLIIGELKKMSADDER